MNLYPFRQITEAAPPGAGVKKVYERRATLEQAIEAAKQALLGWRNPEGYWCAEFEADCTIPSEYILMMHFMDEVDESIERKIANYLRAKFDSGCHGWTLYPGGAFDMSATVKAYFALKLAGDDPTEPHMQQAREAVLERGGAVFANVFTHITLALFEQIPWRAVPFIPVEIMLLPNWFPFHIRKVSYWSRTVMVPLFVLCTLKPKAVNPSGIGIRELFTTAPEDEQRWFPRRSWLNRLFLGLDWVGRGIEPLVPNFVRQLALKRAEDFVVERMNGDHGLGGIFPAMVNAHEMFRVLGYTSDHEYRRQSKEALSRFLVVKPDEAYCQPCVSPVWDTGLASLALQSADERKTRAEVLESLDWLAARQLLDEPGDWQWNRPDLPGGGWAFEFRNDHYPDIDDTPVVAWAMLQSGEPRFANAIERAAVWIEGMQSSNGGWASFDVDNTYYYLNEIPFADHGALLDPPTADVTARCISFLSLYDRERFAACIERGLAFLRAEQEQDGPWFGRWGTNYIYGTWSVLVALELAGEDRGSACIQRAVSWLEGTQRSDGGWGESNDSYEADMERAAPGHSTTFQTAWAVLALMAAGQQGESVRHGIEYLRDRQTAGGDWEDDDFTAPGFPRVFYLKYHGYTSYFPLWALADFRERTRAGDGADGPVAPVAS